MAKKSEFEGKTITELVVLYLQKGLDTTGDKETLITQLLGKERPRPEPKATK